MPRPACRRDPYRGKAITQTSLQLARYPGERHRYRENDPATAAIAPPSLLLLRNRENDAATAAICGTYRLCCGRMHAAGSFVIREATKHQRASNVNNAL